MRVRLLVVVLSLFALSIGSIQGAVSQTADFQGFQNGNAAPLPNDRELQQLHPYDTVDLSPFMRSAATPLPDFTDSFDELGNIRELHRAKGNEPIVPLTIFGPDERIQSSPALPTVAWVLAVLDWGDGVRGELTGDELISSCTATFVGPQTLITAGHCVYIPKNADQIRQGEPFATWAVDIIVVPGLNGDDFPFGVAVASGWAAHPAWVSAMNSASSLDPQNLTAEFLSTRDLGLITLPDTALGSAVGWHSVGALSTSSLEAPDFNPVTFGYPGDKNDGTQWVAAQASIDVVTDDYLFFNELDVFHGQSGSAIFRPSDTSIVGIISWGDERYNAAVRINEDALAFFLAICQQASCEIAYFIESAPSPEPTSPPPPRTPPSSSIAFQNTWARTDQPVAQGAVSRTWMWGPTALTPELQEPYTGDFGTARTIQYFDKSRMEVTNPNGDPNSIWYVTNGLLVRELVTGRLQLGDDVFEQHNPAQVNVAGDVDDPTGPTYATFAALQTAAPTAEGTVVTQRVDRSGSVSFDASFSGQNVTAARYVPETNHTVASVFWNFMNSEGLVFQNGTNEYAPLFENAFYATGYPITEAYWASVKVGGTYRNVLIQVFERRVLTYTPGNPVGWDVEAGNVGQHYHQWRYTEIPNEDATPPPPPPSTPTPDPTPSPTPTPAPPSDSDTIPEEGEILGQTDFSDWDGGTTDVGSSFFTDGTFHIRVTEPGYLMYHQTEGDSFRNVSASLDLRMVSKSGRAEGCLSYRVDPGGYFSHAYSLCINERGETFALYEGFDNDNQYFSEVLVDIDNHAGARPTSEWNTLKIIGKGNQFWFLVNGMLIGTATHNGPVQGAVGMRVGNPDNVPAEFEFTNLVVRAVQ